MAEFRRHREVYKEYYVVNAYHYLSCACAYESSFRIHNLSKRLPRWSDARGSAGGLWKHIVGFIQEKCIAMVFDQPVAGICDLKPSDKSSWREIFIVFKEKAVRRSMPLLKRRAQQRFAIVCHSHAYDSIDTCMNQVVKKLPGWHAIDNQPLPCESRKSRRHPSHGRADVIYNHRPLSLSPPPIVIYHPVFNKFLGIVNDQTLIFTHEELDNALNSL
ncbi:hypothetical protein BDP27DRAFT_727945 [Rhodocollybia butyracea]|uniref:Uncharacterized protein n=1 Tax=Rhodocollybia butyracea TaxID=206335 RepID=A0A9P5P5S2_9AGAR|nr:hypothetical protein BDP27DRAFT_727945 [Rhodocollybia butyracea]